MTFTLNLHHVELGDGDRICVAPDRSTVYRCHATGTHRGARDLTTNNTITTGDNR